MSERSELTSRTAALALTSRKNVSGRSTRVRGTLKVFHANRGYGFIDHGTGRDLFVHRSNVAGGEVPQSGETVEFAVGEGRRGPEAVDVRVLAGAH